MNKCTESYTHSKFFLMRISLRIHSSNINASCPNTYTLINIEHRRFVSVGIEAVIQNVLSKNDSREMLHWEFNRRNIKHKS